MTALPAEIKVADYKIVLLGESSVGKSSIVERFQMNIFNDKKSSTIGAAFINKKIVVDTVKGEPTKMINFQIWDTAGQERFHDLTPLYYRNANLALVVYDVTNDHSVVKADYWINQLEEFPEIQVVLVGNKVDLESSIDEEELTKLQNSHTDKIIGEFKTSAKLGDGIKEMFEFITKNVGDEYYHGINDDNDNNGLIDLNYNNQNTHNQTCLC